MGYADSWGDCACVGSEGVCRILYFSLNFAVEPKTAKTQLNLKLNFAVKPKVALKNKVY